MCVLKALEDGACYMHSQHFSLLSWLCSESPQRWFQFIWEKPKLQYWMLSSLDGPDQHLPFLITAIPHSIRVRTYEGLVSKGDST